jgi:uncharacterized protein (DUF1015 family)
MAQIQGLTGLRPSPTKVSKLTSPPYDVIKEGSPLETLLQKNTESLYHIILGEAPKATLDKYTESGILQKEEEAAYYVYEQNWEGGSRRGCFVAVAVDEYSEGNIVRHEKTFDSKVKGRMKLAQETGHTIGPIFLLTKSPISAVLDTVKAEGTPEYEFTTDLDGNSDLHGIHNRVFRVLADSEAGKALQSVVAENPLYIADGHHRYHAALRNGQSHTLAYIVQDAKIQAYNRVIKGAKLFADIKDSLPLTPCDTFHTPEKHSFCIYSKEGTYLLKASDVPSDVVGKLDCSILEKELYPSLGVNHDMILDQNYFDYYAESELETMKAQVDSGKYDIAVALHPVSIDELMDVANAGLQDSDIVMPEKSTFFAPKILSGLFLYEH